MPSKTATLNVGAAYDGRLFAVADHRRILRAMGAGIAQSLGAVIAVGLLVAIVTMAAAWIVNSALVTGPQSAKRSFNGPRTLALAASAPALTRTSDTTFDSKWAQASVGSLPLMPQGIMMADAVAPAGVVPLPPRRVAARAPIIPLPHERPQMPQVEVAQIPAQIPVLAPAEPFGPQVPPHIPPQVTAHVTPQAAPQVAMVTPPAAANDKRAAPPQAPTKAAAGGEINDRTAVYDISARTVFLPSGERLEAHSGLYDKMDDPRYVNVRMRGPTPPNVYDLTLRQQLFHGVRAIRLNPVDEGKMFGRDGMLAHTYMLGPNGQSNGCVSFKDYDKFLQAFLRGEVDRLVVVPKGGTRLALAARSHRGKIGRYAANDAPPERYTGSW